MIEIYAVNLKHQLPKEVYHLLLSNVSGEKQDKIGRFHRIQDAQRSLISDVLVRRIITDKLGRKNEDIVFEYNEYGKPALKQQQDFCFNTSHAGDWIVCAVHTLPVGIDVEHIQPIEFDIAKRFFSQEEYQDLMQKEDSERLSYFYELWTLKEAYIKAVGKGLSIPLNSFSFRIPFEDILFKSKEDTRNYSFKQYKLAADYKMAVCGMNSSFADEVKLLKAEELITFY